MLFRSRLDFCSGTNEYVSVEPEAKKQILDFYKQDPENAKKQIYGFLGSVVFFIAFLSLIGLGIDKELHRALLSDVFFSCREKELYCFHYTRF